MATSITNQTVKVLYPYDAHLRDELTIRPDDVIDVENQSGDWLKGKIRGSSKASASGLFYKEFVVPFISKEQSGSPQISRKPLEYSVEYKQSSYYTTEKPGEDLECIICHRLANDPRQTGCCGHTICLDCGSKWKDKNDSCPHCRKSPVSLLEDPRIKRHISGLIVYCCHYKTGCEWRGSLNDINYHLRHKCQFTVVNCQRYKCRKELQRRYLSNHEINECPRRPVKCPCCNDCEISHQRERCSSRGDDDMKRGWLTALWAPKKPVSSPIMYHDLISTHYKHCPSWPMRCPNHCGTEEKLTRSTLQDHIDNNCPEQVISCQFAEAGCTVKVKRKEMADHIQKSVEEHLIAMMRDHVKLKMEHSKLTREHNNLQKDYELSKKKIAALEKSRGK